MEVRKGREGGKAVREEGKGGKGGGREGGRKLREGGKGGKRGGREGIKEERRDEGKRYTQSYRRF